MEGQPSLVEIERLADRSGPVFERDQLFDMQAATLGVDQLIHADAVDLHHADAGQSRAGLGQRDAPDGLSLLLQQLGTGVVDVDRHHDDRAAVQPLGHLAALCARLGAQGEEPAFEGLDHTASLQLFGTPGQCDLAGVLQVERELACRLVAASRVDLQALQDHFLQPGWTVAAQRARWYRVDIQAPTQAANAVGLTERSLAGREVVEHHAEREQVAARVVADELHLLGRHVRPGAHRQRELLVEQVGQVVVARQAEIDHHRAAVGPEHDVAGLDV